MGSIETRPTGINALTSDNVMIGMPYVEFAPAIGSPAYGPFRQLGIISEARITKAIEAAALRSAQSGIDVLVKEIVRSLEARLIVSVFQFDKDNMQLFFGSSTLTTLNAGTGTVTNEAAELQAAATDWSDLANSLVTTMTSLDPATVTNEAVGTGDGSLGGTTGDFILDFPVLVIGDVTGFTVGGVDESAKLVSGSTPGAAEIAIVVGDVANSGSITFGSGEIPANGAAIVATYLSTHSLTENTDFSVDYPGGRIRRISGSNKLRGAQPLLVDYSYTTFDGGVIAPFTQLTFEGQLRIKLLTDVGINLTWTIPSVNLKLTDTDFEFNREEFAAGELSITLVDDGTTQPYGTMNVYEESAA